MIDIRRIGAGESVAVDENVAIAIPPGFGVGSDADVSVSGCLTNFGKSFALEAQGKCDIDAVCSLCLTPMRLSVVFQIDEKFVEENPDADDIIFSDKMIDLVPAIERGLYVNLPMKPQCNADCAGLCPNCGHNLNEDSCNCGGVINEQFRQLLQLFENKEV